MVISTHRGDPSLIISFALLCMKNACMHSQKTENTPLAENFNPALSCFQVFYSSKPLRCWDHLDIKRASLRFAITVKFTVGASWGILPIARSASGPLFNYMEGTRNTGETGTTSLHHDDSDWISLGKGLTNEKGRRSRAELDLSNAWYELVVLIKGLRGVGVGVRERWLVCNNC